jgi:hypothetical protein
MGHIPGLTELLFGRAFGYRRAAPIEAQSLRLRPLHRRDPDANDAPIRAPSIVPPATAGAHRDAALSARRALYTGRGPFLRRSDPEHVRELGSCSGRGTRVGASPWPQPPDDPGLV